ncbi:MAG: hypothetical protein ACRDAM_09910, partial [Casimicrobium sp.]
MNKFGVPTAKLFHGVEHAEKVSGGKRASAADPANTSQNKPIDTSSLTPNTAAGTKRTESPTSTSGATPSNQAAKTGDSSGNQLQALLGNKQETTPPDKAGDSQCAEDSTGAGQSESKDLMQMLKK